MLATITDRVLLLLNNLSICQKMSKLCNDKSRF